MKKLLVIWVMLLGLGPAKSQSRAFGFKQLDSLQKIAQRKVLVFVYTDWCSYCKAMEQQVFNARTIQEELKQNYYWIALNAEEKSPISYRGHTFVFKASKGVHELAIALMSDEKQMAFPFLTILDANNQICFQYEGFMNVAELKKVLAYFKR
ncbi:thioredoxin fold domain-containing protein [Pedobacter sp. KR3-3]|uniref:Thioredoxin fold domain-containing protein n=1 Tax=Pedobacter albus TaxID=3113905 RepID=A0ABU7I394_9SPHI|nr:thioredoxin fold domain-containing protein [Pedobacter sp. KR3-3]MEE1943882.1 thioredoxin fold domain-containing protein [Pedobacter sp. KR3-3]